MEPHPVVLKFGSSALRSAADLPKAVTEIMRWRRDGSPVLAVVSAIGDETDALAADAVSFRAASDSVNHARLMSLGEARAAALLALACEQAGVDARVLDAAALNWRATGARDDAAPTSVDVERLRDALAAPGAVIVPGFAALDERGDPVLLGRGGCDLAAVFLGHALGAAEIRLIKDVDGVYDRDPACAGERPARRYAAVSWEKARRASDGLIQPKALSFAQDMDQPFTLAAFGRDAASVVGRKTASPALTKRRRPLRVALAGCGVVGGGVLRRLSQESDRFYVTRVLVKDKTKPRQTYVKSAYLTDDFEALFQDSPDVVVEATTGIKTALRLYEAALTRGVAVATANKQAVAFTLANLTRKPEAPFRYAAAVGGGTPMVETVRAAKRAGRIVKLEGVLTGAANFVLDALASGESLEAAVQAAQRAGFAEANPNDDLEGRDAAAKLRILAHEAFGAEGSRLEVETRPITAKAAANRVPLRQIARLKRQDERTTASIRVEAAKDQDPLFAELGGARCALRVTLADGRVFATRGLGAGRWPTTESVLSDLGDIARDLERSSACASTSQPAREIAE